MQIFYAPTVQKCCDIEPFFTLAAAKRPRRSRFIGLGSAPTWRDGALPHRIIDRKTLSMIEIRDSILVPRSVVAASPKFDATKSLA